MKRWRRLCPIPKHSSLLIVACVPWRAERGNAARSCLCFRGYVTAYPTECKLDLKARYALANCQRSTPYSDSSARNRTSEVIVFCTGEPRRSLSTGVRERCILRSVVLIGDGTLAITCVSRSLNAACCLYRVSASTHWLFGPERHPNHQTQVGLG